MYSRINYTVVGLFVLLFGIAATVFAFWLARYGINERYDLYKLYMTESVSGLSKDSPVKLHGVEIGRVKAIRIDPNNVERVEILLAIKHGIPIKADMVAHTTMMGVTGLLSIDIEGGSNEAPTLQPAPDRIPVIKAAPSWLHTAQKDLGGLVARLNVLSERLANVLDTNNTAHIASILKHTDTLSQAGMSVLREINATAVAYQDAIRTIGTKLDRAVAHVDEVAQGLNVLKQKSVPAIETLTRTARHFDRLTRKVERSLDRGDYNIRKIFEPLLIDAHRLSEQLVDLVQTFEESPSDLLFRSRHKRKGPGE